MLVYFILFLFFNCKYEKINFNLSVTMFRIIGSRKIVSHILTILVTNRSLVGIYKYYKNILAIFV